MIDLTQFDEREKLFYRLSIRSAIQVGYHGIDLIFIEQIDKHLTHIGII